MSKSHLFAGLGMVLIVLSIGTRLWVYGAENEARRIGNEELASLARLSELRDNLNYTPPDDKPKATLGLSSLGALSDSEPIDSKLQSVNVNLQNSTGEWYLLHTEPPGAKSLTALHHHPLTAKSTPTIISRETTEFTLETPYRRTKVDIEHKDFRHRQIRLSPKPLCSLLFSLFYPGLIFVGLGWYIRKPKRKEREPSDSGVTMVRSPLPLPESGPVRHDPDTPPELIFGDFIQGEHLGKGNMGEVYRCTSGNAADERAYALKVLLPEWSNSDDFRKRFEREAAICQKLDHPNLVRAYQSGEKNGRLWLVMDYISGGELKDWLTQSERSVDELLALFQQVCSGLDYAHQNEVIHRDLKPDNILITENSQAVIADFGLARGKHYETITKTNTTLGTPIYMPPELVVGGTGSPSGDLYGLGCILYEMLAGRPPFEQTDVLMLLQDKLNGKMPPPLDQVSPELNDLVFKLLAYKPEDRYQSASELSEALSSLN